MLINSHKFLKLWGSLAKVVILNRKMTKIGKKKLALFLLVMLLPMVHEYIYKSDILGMHVNTVIEYKNASFFKHIFPCKFTQESNSFKRKIKTMTSTFHD